MIRQLVGLLRPKILAAVGVSSLLSEDLKLGDVVVATRGVRICLRRRGRSRSPP